MSTAWIVSVGSYSDYEVLAVALTQEDAQRWADAYTEARESLYRDEAQVETVELYEAGGPLPRRVISWNADDRSEWQHTETATRDPEPTLRYNPGYGSRGPLAVGFPSREAARAAVDEALRES